MTTSAELPILNHERDSRPFDIDADELANARINEITWDRLAEQGAKLGFPRPVGPSKNGSARCESGSVASGGVRTYCTCGVCW